MPCKLAIIKGLNKYDLSFQKQIFGSCTCQICAFSLRFSSVGSQRITKKIFFYILNQTSGESQQIASIEKLFSWVSVDSTV